MTRSIFDPNGGHAEHSGSAFTPPEADQISHLPEQPDEQSTAPADDAEIPPAKTERPENPTLTDAD